ncbi:MAG: Ubiquinone/menaquinone biosynthesis C-methyltransferase UbiE [Candidatus Thorarchaeota archaeon]|nr:MAG: Ubiquinone/menaquinone biosynthesis C-methyltransferase UbiE [Candidatus Thorarchaeota archaeon]
MADLAKADWSDSDRVKSIADSYHRRYGDHFWKELVQLVESVSIHTLGDFGCGPGLFLRDAVKEFNASKIIGIDASKEMLSYAREISLANLSKVKVELIEQDFDKSRINLPTQSVDLGFSGYVLHEVADPYDFVQQIYRTINFKGGYVVYDFVSGNPDEFVKIMSEGHMDPEKARKRYPHMCKHSISDIEDILIREGFSGTKSVQLDPIRAIVLGIKGSGQ